MTDPQPTPPDIYAIARSRLANGRHIADSDVVALLDEIERLRVTLKVCADDLASYITQEYGAPPHSSPSMARRYEQDMAFVRDVRKLVGGDAA